MKITNVKAVYPKYNYVAPSWRTHFWQIVVKIETDAGVSGFGYGGGGVAAVEIVNRHFRELLTNKDINSVDDIHALWDYLYAESLPYGRKGVAIMALSGVDLALYDLLGRAQSKPVYELIGGLNKERVHAYATGNDTSSYKDLGFNATKFAHRWTGNDSDYDKAIESASLARDTFGPDALIMIDTYMSWDSKVTQEMARRLSEYNIYWFEDVTTPDELQAQAELRPLVKPVLISGGEHEFTHFGFNDIANVGALDLWQPDITWCGGITAGHRIVDLAKEAGIPVVPHRGGEVWGLHLIVATDCDDLAEVHSGTFNTNRDELWFGEPKAKSGYIAPSDEPGFGVTLNEAML